MGESKKKTETRVFSVRLPVDLADRIDGLAAQSGLSRTDYIRIQLEEGQQLVDVAALDDVVSASRRIEQAAERYLVFLDGLRPLCEGEGKEGALGRIASEVERMDDLMSLAFNVQRQAMRILAKIRSKAK